MLQRSTPRGRPALLLGACLASFVGGQASAQEGYELDAIVVTAQKRAENVQDVPMSVSAYSGQMLERAGVSSITDLATSVPSLSVEQSSNARNTAITIRGIGSSGTNPGIEPSVGVFVDGVYLPTAGMIQGELLDIEAVEILRGPQGTLYGRNTPVGAINITTLRPSKDFQARIRVGGGDYELRHATAYVSGPLSDGVYGSASFWIRERDGYEANLFSGRPTNDASTYGGRVRLAWDVTEDLRVDLIGAQVMTSQTCCVPDHIDPTGPFGVATAGFLAGQAALGTPFRNFGNLDRVVDANDNGYDDIKNTSLSAQIEWSVPGHTLTSITSYQKWDNSARVQTGALPSDVLSNRQSTVYDTWSQEFRIASSGEGRLDYMGGLYLFAQDTDYFQSLEAGPGANRVFPAANCGAPAPCRVFVGDTAFSNFDQKTRSWALFGTATFRVTDRFHVAGGLRYSYDEKTADIDHDVSPGASVPWFRQNAPNPIGRVTRDEDSVTWSANARYHVSSDVMLFATAANGFKSGGFNSRRVAPGTPFEFDREKSMTYEAGVKSELLDRRLVLNLTAFHMTLEDFQESVLNPLPGVGFIVGNAGEREVQGIEIDVRARPTRALSIDGGVSYMDAEFTDRSAGPCAVGQTPNGTSPGSCNFNGLTPERSPKWKGSIAAQYTHDLSEALQLVGRAEVTYRSSQ